MASCISSARRKLTPYNWSKPIFGDNRLGGLSFRRLPRKCFIAMAFGKPDTGQVDDDLICSILKDKVGSPERAGNGIPHWRKTSTRNHAEPFLFDQKEKDLG